MRELLIEYGYIPAGIMFLAFAVLWLSIPYYVKQCTAIVEMMDMIKKDGMLIKENIGWFSFTYMFSWDYLFAALPNEQTHPAFFKYKYFKDHIEEAKGMRSIYKTATIVFPIFLILLFAGVRYANPDKEHYIEAQPSFKIFQNADLTSLQWKRSNDNLKMFHETFKKIGYENIIDKKMYLSDPFIFMGVYINKPLCNILDSLEYTYYKKDSIPEYYQKFWARRDKEGNASTVFVIVQEINQVMREELHPAYVDKYVNDTLYNLLYIEYRKDKLSEKVALENFNLFKKYGLNQSAYNFVYGTNKYDNLKLNVDSLKSNLTVSKEYTDAWYRYDIGP